ncbi:hypothetical protein BGX38DRAFT_551728 [Terfezia claveryi]|nr:hypothetical protein BGX38DRAFT_551728 [Terfezia claveryi]
MILASAASCIFSGSPLSISKRASAVTADSLVHPDTFWGKRASKEKKNKVRNTTHQVLEVPIWVNLSTCCAR